MSSIVGGARLSHNPRDPSEARDIFDRNDCLASIDTLIAFNSFGCVARSIARSGY